MHPLTIKYWELVEGKECGASLKNLFHNDVSPGGLPFSSGCVTIDTISETLT